MTCLPRQFILLSRSGETDSSFKNLHDAGRLDIAYECIVTSLFLSHGLRRDVIFHAILNGPPKPPLHLQIDGAKLYDVRTDIDTWQQIFRKTLAGKPHPGVTVDKTSFEVLLRTQAESRKVYVLEEGGENVADLQLAEDAVFVLGDHVGLPRNVERFALRFGEKVSLGKQPYLAASCITIINYLLDYKAKAGF